MNINELAEKEYPFLEQDSELEYSRNAMRNAARVGFTKGAELAIGFADWVGRNEYTIMYETWYDYNDLPVGDTPELFQIYLNQLNNK